MNKKWSKHFVDAIIATIVGIPDCASIGSYVKNFELERISGEYLKVLLPMA